MNRSSYHYLHHASQDGKTINSHDLSLNTHTEGKKTQHVRILINILTHSHFTSSIHADPPLPQTFPMNKTFMISPHSTL